MIPITPTLEAAAGAASRSPIARVTVEPVSVEPVAITSPCGSFVNVTFQKSSSGYWFATCADGSHFYYRKQTAPCTAAEWPCNVGSWTQGDTVAINYPGYHDVAIDGNTIIMAYMERPNVYIRRSTDAASSWNQVAVDLSAYLYSLPSYTYKTFGIIAPNVSTVYVYGRKDSSNYTYRWVRLDWDGATWNVTSTYDGTARLWPTEITVPGQPAMYSAWARELDRYHALAPTMECEPPGRYWGDPSGSGFSFYTTQGRITCGESTVNWSPFVQSFGKILDDVNFKTVMIGCSREINGYYYALIEEYYGTRAEPGSLTKDRQFFIGKTDNFIHFDLVPFTTGSRLYHCAGFAICEDGDHIIAPINSGGSEVVYKIPISSFWGYPNNSTDITSDIVDQTNIAYLLDASSRATINLENSTGAYDDSDIVKSPSRVIIEAGYKTSSGNELQQRFTGNISNIGLSPNIPDTAVINVMDNLFRAGFSSGSPRIIRGPNAIFATFDSEEDIDLFVPQGGNWFWNSIGSMDDASRGEETISFLGSEASMNQIVIGAIRWRPNLGTPFCQSVGIAFGGSSEYPDKTFVFRLRNDDKLEFGYINLWASLPVFMSLGSIAYSIAPGHFGPLNTTLWFMAINRCGNFDMYTSSGATWTLRMTRQVNSYGGYPINGYVGVYHYSDETVVPSGSSYNPRLLQFLYQSMDLPYTGSDIMGFMASESGMESAEIVEIEDGFTGVAFSSRWDDPGVDGTWSVSGGEAHGAKSAADPTTIRCDFSAEDVVVQCDVVASSDLAGVIARADSGISECYAGMITTTTAEVWKQSGGVWELLTRVAIALSGTIRLKFRCFKGFLSLYVDDYMIAIAHDEDITSGYVGMASDGSTSDHDNFLIHGFYMPVEVVVLRPTDKPIGLMQQISEMHSGGHFYCNYEGNLVWGIFDDDTVDLDLSTERNAMITIGVDVSTDQIITSARVEGKNAYAEYRDLDWAMALGMNRYMAVQNAWAQSAAACYSNAISIVDDGKRIRRNTLVIKGNPGLEPGDLLRTKLRVDGVGKNSLLLAFGEVIGDGYEQTINETAPIDVEAP
jgi:hypothetical protein